MHPIKRGALIALLTFGAFAGFAHGFAHVGAACGSGGCHQSWEQRRDQHITDLATSAAERVYAQHARDRVPPAPPPAPAYGVVYAAPPPPPGYYVPAQVIPQALPAPVAPVAIAPSVDVTPVAPSDAPAAE